MAFHPRINSRKALGSALGLTLVVACSGESGGPSTTLGEIPPRVEEALVATQVALDSFWGDLLERHGHEYSPPRVAPHRAGELPATDCAADTNASEWVATPKYCFLDRTVVYDLDFLARIYSEHGHDRAAAVLAHEWGHHVQAITGRPRKNLQQELQADCYAGTYLANQDVDPTNIDSALNSVEGFIEGGNEAYQQSGWFDINEHGSPVLRWSAFILGSLGLGDLSMCDGYADYEPSPPIALGDYVIAHLPGYEVETRDNFVYLRRGLVEVRVFLIGDSDSGRRAVEVADETWDSYFRQINVIVLQKEEPQLSSTPHGDWASWVYEGATNAGAVVAGFWRLFDPDSGAALIVDGFITDPPVTLPLDAAELLILSGAGTATYGLENFLCVPGQSANKGSSNYSFSCALEE